ncbi:MAG: hypothetical protein ACTSV7_15000 [Candidatus Baldrarchaeia archaeon]
MNKYSTRKAISTFKFLQESLNTPEQVTKQAVLLYRRASKNNILRGRLLKMTLPVIFYTSCRLCKEPITLKEVMRASNLKCNNHSFWQLKKFYRQLVKTFKLKIPQIKISTFVLKIVNELNLNPEVQNYAIKLTKVVQEKDLGNHQPSTIAAGIVYLACKTTNNYKPAKEIAKVIAVTPSSARFVSRRILRVCFVEE